MIKFKHILFINVILIGALIFALQFVDVELARFIKTHNNVLIANFFQRLTVFVDNQSKNLLLIFLGMLLVALFLLFFQKAKRISLVLITCVITNLSCQIIVNVLKVQVKRQRPDVFLKTQEIQGNEKSKDYSFPSSHTSFYLSLFFPFIFLSKKWRFIVLIFPFVIILGRIVLNEHYLSDVLFSILLVVDVGVIVFKILKYVDEKINLLLLRA